jgi:hypothetical protein
MIPAKPGRIGRRRTEVCMRWRGGVLGRNGRTLGIALLILSLVHTPLPQPDYHNIRHHDGAGEVCAYHDHLLRWHPTAGGAQDVAVLHWHWFLPTAPEPGPQGSGLALHAHSPDWQTSCWESGGPQITPDSSSRPTCQLALSPLDLPLTIIDPAHLGAAPQAGIHPPLAFGATFAPRVSLTSLLHRWVC